MQKRIGVIGTFIRDTIVTLDGRKVESIGGLYHTMAYLSSLVEADTFVQPLCHVGNDFYETIHDALKRLSANVLFDGMYRVSQPNTQVTLTYRSREMRDEVTSAPMPPITTSEIAAVAECDAVLVNLISGNDVALEALTALRKSRPSPLIYLDLHSLALGIDATGRRYYRTTPNWREWLAACHILQVNEREAATLAGCQEQFTRGDLLNFGKYIAAELVSACHITLGSNGSLLFYRHEGDMRYEHCPPYEVPQVIDIIGCGDAFGAAFLAHFLRMQDFSAATHFANKVAGLNCTFMGSLTPAIFQETVKPQLERQNYLVQNY
ncbi:carbohydrate kinase family protein [candidate division KSB1 bacterium]|nr:carbohydrate kinase family protein [candidate division KSB1 bacterium]